jgi:hypothetical protein
MASRTPLAMRNLVICEIFTRNHGPHGNAVLYKTVVNSVNHIVSKLEQLYIKKLQDSLIIN